MFKLMKYLKGKALLCAILAPLVMILEVSMDLMQPTLMANIIDIGVANGDMQYVLVTGAKMIGIAVVGLIGGASCSVLAAIAGMGLGEKLREVLFGKLQTLSFLELDRFKTSSLITRLTNDVTQVQNLVMMGLKMAVRAPFMCIGGIVMAMYLSRDLTIVFVIAIPIILAIVVVSCMRSFPLFKKMQEKIDGINKVMRESLLGVRVIKAFNLQPIEKEKFNKSNEELMITSIKAQNITMIMMPLVMLVVNLSVVVVLWYGGHLVNNNRLAAGNIMAFINYLLQIMFSMMMVIMMVINFSRAKASSDRINEVLDAVPSIRDSKEVETVTNWDIEFKDVSFRYHEHSEDVLSHISFKVNEGQKVGIIGATGSGKSSLVGLIPRLYDATEGAVLVGGKDVRTLGIKDLREHIGIVLQESILFSGTIEDNLRFGKESAKTEELEGAARDAQAYEFIENKEGGYGSVVEQRGKNLSGGQKQRLSIARTLVRNPKVLILDDSSSALDMATESKLQKAIKERLQGATLLIIAQRISAVKDADQIIVLEDGQISGMGTHEELIQCNEIYRSIAISQLGEEAVLHG